MTISPVYTGIDVSKAYLDVFDPQWGASRIANSGAALAALVARFQAAGRFVVFEATGLYDLALRHALEDAGVAHARLNPFFARKFAGARGKKAKTDRIDARMLQEFGQRMTPPERTPADREREELALLVKRRDQLVAMRQQEQVRRCECHDPAMVARIDRHLAVLNEETAGIETEIHDRIAASANLKAAAARLRSMPGVGEVTSAKLLAMMPELGRLKPGEVASLAGLAPFNNDSGGYHGKRCIKGGRKPVRDALYMVALTASRMKNRFGSFYTKLRAKGKPAKVALTALARKMLTVLNAMMREGKDWVKADALDKASAAPAA